MDYSPLFNEIVEHHIRVEGGWVNDPFDPGSETYKGIARAYNPHWSGWQIIDAARSRSDFPSCLNANADLHEAVKAYYYAHYWKPMNLDSIEQRDIVAELFDIGAGPNGIHAAGMIAQGALILLNRDVALDGKIGPITASTLEMYIYPDDLVKMMGLLQFVHLLVGSSNVDETVNMIRGRLPQLKRFMRGWLRRI